MAKTTKKTTKKVPARPVFDPERYRQRVQDLPDAAEVLDRDPRGHEKDPVKVSYQSKHIVALGTFLVSLAGLLGSMHSWAEVYKIETVVSVLGLLGAFLASQFTESAKRRPFPGSERRRQ